MSFFVRRGPSPPQLFPVIKPLSLRELREGKQYPDDAILITEGALIALQRFLQHTFSVQEAGLPPGGYTSTASIIQAGASAESGSISVGWAAGNHKHSIETGAAEGLAPDSENAEGDGTAIARADHSHDMSEVMAGVLSAVSLGA